ncbi:MAG: TRAP transporter large permease subunit [Gammaproteobacteria bacterium]|nr:TRAP transporter large permease subunit [Gammaproteobacteria bacterium]
MRKELRFGFALMAIILISVIVFMPWGHLTNGHLGLLMLALIVVAIMMGFPTAFTLMGMGMIFAWLAYRSVNPDLAVQQTLDLMVQRAYGVMTNDVLISIPLFVFMGYIVERANLIEKLFKSIHLAMARIPGSLAVATLVTCAIFATATGIIGAVVTLMGLLALPPMLRAGYDVRVSAGVITAGGTLGILIPPSVLLIVYGATAGVSVVQLYAGAFFPGIMLASLYVGYVIVLAKWKPRLAPPLPMEERVVPLPEANKSIAQTISHKALPGLLRALKGRRNVNVPTGKILRQLIIVLLPGVFWLGCMGVIYKSVTAPPEVMETAGLVEMGTVMAPSAPSQEETGAPGVEEPVAEGVQEPPGAEPTSPTQADSVQEPPGAEPTPAQPAGKSPPGVTESHAEAGANAGPQSAPMSFWIGLGVVSLFLVWYYWRFTFERLEVFKMLLSSFFPLAVLILAVLGSIVFGLATPTEAAAVGALGGFVLAALYKRLNLDVVKESVFLTAKTSAMVCWLFVGSSIFSAAFALLGGQEIIEHWVLSLNMTPTQFMLLAQFIIFILGWPLEWTEIIVIFMPIFIPLLAHFNIDPLFFGLLVALNLQTAFLSPPVAMAAFYLKGVAPPHVSLNQIFAGMMPFMAIQVLAIFLLYWFPQIGLWLPSILYK